MGTKIRGNYEKWSKNLNDFNWDKPKSKAPPHCVENECMNIESDMVDNDEILKYSEDDIFYGYGTTQKKTPLKISSNFCLSRIFNIMSLVPEALPGLHNSYIYFGTPQTFFPVHVEDALLLSVNFLHIGRPKIW